MKNYFSGYWTDVVESWTDRNWLGKLTMAPVLTLIFTFVMLAALPMVTLCCLNEAGRK
jgi:hypothetical protein